MKILYDTDIRQILFDHLDQKYGKVRTFEEKIIGKSRSDVIAVTDGAIIGLEIKSDADSYTRLPTQVRDYDRFFDMNLVVVGKSHERGVSKHIPPYWGILCICEDDGVFSLKVAREALPNPKVKIKHQLSLMWKRELWGMLDKSGLPKYRQKSRKFICDKLIERIDEAALRRLITNELFERDYTQFDDVPKIKVKTAVKRTRRRTK